MTPRGLSQNALARALNVPPRRINEIVMEKRSITADTALRLAKYFGTSAELWIGLQTEHDLRRGPGVRPPQPEWGIMVAEGATHIISGEWWVALFPGAVLMLAVFCFNLLGDGLRDILDPRMRT